MLRQRTSAAGIAVAVWLLLLAACSQVDSGMPTPTPTPTSPPQGGAIDTQAPEFTGISTWINSEPLTMAELRGKVVLIDFWTYTCVNCVRTLPYLRQWHERYADHGLVIVGVHSPEFEFEKLTENVERAVAQFGLAYPVAQDNDFGTWRSYNNRFWPAKYLVDRDGIIRYRHFGEGAYVETETRIREMLTEAGADLSGVPAGEDDGPVPHESAYAGDLEDRVTREIYGGYLRNATIGGLYVAHPEYYEGPDRTVTYEDPGSYVNQFIYLQGLWTNGNEALRHARATEENEDYIAFRFLGSSVNAVVGYDGEPYEVLVTLDGAPLNESNAGPDIVIEEGKSYFRVTEARMYEVINLRTYGTGIVKLSSNSDQFSFYALTFSPYGSGP